jgi:excisionase family DNA binding protein
VKTRGKRKTIDLLTSEEVADQLKVSVFTVRRWINRDELPAYRVGRAWRISSNELSTWLEKRQKHHERLKGPQG